jgi:transposase
MSSDGRFYDLPSREQIPLLAPSLRQEVAGETELLALEAALAQLDLREIEAQYPRVGAPGYPPRVLLGVLIYGYSQGLRASRKLDAACRYDVRFRFLTHGLRPDFRTLCRFRRDQAEALKRVFRQTVALCQEIGLVFLKQVATDGSKVRANRSRRALVEVEGAFALALEEAEAADGEIPPEAAGAPEEECAFMKVAGEGIKPAYNAQVAVDGAHQVIVAQDLIAAPNDQGQLAPLLAQVEENCGAAPEAALADGGYLNQDDLETVEQQGATPYLPVPETGVARMEWGEEEQAFRCPQGHWLRAYRFRKGKRIYRTTRCAGCPQAAACGVTGRAKEVHVTSDGGALRRLAGRMANGGKELYRSRSKIVEPIFAFFKHNRGFRRFLLRGRRGAGAEWSLLCIAHNLGKWAAAWLGRLSPTSAPPLAFSQAECRRIGSLLLRFLVSLSWHWTFALRSQLQCDLACRSRQHQP